MGNKNVKKSKVVAEEHFPKFPEQNEKEEEEKKIDNQDLKISKAFSELKIERNPSNSTKLQPSFTSEQIPSLKTKTTARGRKKNTVQKPLDISKKRTSISLNENELNTMKGMNSTNTSTATLDLGGHKSSSYEIRKQAYLAALKEALFKKGLGASFVNDGILLLKSYMNAENWIKIFDITFDSKEFKNQICIGIENSFNSTQKIKIISFKDLILLNEEINRIGKFCELKGFPEIGEIKDFLVRINRKTNCYYLFIVENFYIKSLEKLTSSQHKMSDFEICKLVKSGIKAISHFGENGVIHGSICPSNIMISMEKSKLSFVFEMRTNIEKTKNFSDNYSFGITILSLLSGQSYDVLSQLNNQALQHLISPISQNFKIILQLFLCNSNLPISLIKKFSDNWKLNGFKSLEIVDESKNFEGKDYFATKISNEVIIIGSLIKNRMVALKNSEYLYKEIISIKISVNTIFFHYKKSTSSFISSHDISTFDFDSSIFQTLDLNEFIRLPDHYSPSEFVFHEETFYFIGGKYKNLPTSKCYKSESGILESLNELSCTSGLGKCIHNSEGLSYFHFGKFAGTVENLNFKSECWNQKKILSSHLRILERTTIFEMEDFLLGISQEEVIFFKDEAIHLRVDDEETREILSSFDKQAYYVPYRILPELYAIYRQNKNERNNEIVLLLIDEFNLILSASIYPKPIVEEKEITENLIEMLTHVQNLEEKISFMESPESKRKYTVRTRFLDRSKENFDDIFLSSLSQCSIKGNHILKPIRMELNSDKISHEISFSFMYDGNYLSLDNYLEERKIVKESDVIRFLSQATRTFEHLKKKKFYFPNFSSSNVLIQENINLPIFIGYEHESKFSENFISTSIHKENMLSLALLAFRMATGESKVTEESFGNLSTLIKGILKPLLEEKADERPNSFEFFMFLKKGKRKRWREIFFINHQVSELRNYLTNSCVGIENRRKVYLLQGINETRLFQSMEGKYGCYNTKRQKFLLFTEKKLRIIDSAQISNVVEVHYPDARISRWNGVSINESVILIGGEYESTEGKKFSSEVFECSLEGKSWRNLPSFPYKEIDGKLQIFFDKEILNAVGFSYERAAVVFASYDFSKGDRGVWSLAFMKWKCEMPTEQVLTFIGPYNSLLVVGLFHTHGILFSRESFKMVRIEVFWKRSEESSHLSPGKKFGVGNGIVWDGNYSKILVGTSNGVFVFTCKIEFPKSIAAITMKPVSDSK